MKPSAKRFSLLGMMLLPIVIGSLMGGEAVLADTPTTSSSDETPTPQPPLQDITIIAAESDGICGLAPDGTVMCWEGYAGYEREGVESVGNVHTLAGGGGHTCALTNDGGVKCWGVNNWGELGNGTATSVSGAVDVLGLDSGVTAITAGFGHSCAVIRGGGVSCWGYNSYGQLGDGTKEDRHTPLSVIGLPETIQSIAAGFGHTCALTSSGGVYCWGNNTYGQLGKGSSGDSTAPTAVSGMQSGITVIAARDHHTCALTSNGGVMCWGENDQGQLGDGTVERRYAPVDVTGLASGVKSLAIGDDFSCALTESGGVKCWGDNRSGQIGDGTNIDRLVTVDVQGLISGVTTITAGSDFACAVTAGGVQCWGENSNLQLSDGAQPDATSPVDVTGLPSKVTAIGAGSDSTCAVMNSGVMCWGKNYSHQLGDGTDVDRGLPITVQDIGSGMQSVAVGGTHTCALSAENRVLCWGANFTGQLGNESIHLYGGPVEPSDLGSGVSAIAAGDSHSCAITTTGGVRCWGENSQGQLGNGIKEDIRTPVDVTGLNNGVKAITAGGDHTCVLTSAGGVQCWGTNYAGILGDGTTEARQIPVDVVGLESGVAAVSTSQYRTCVITEDRRVKCWGGGPLGDGTNDNSIVPVDVIGLTDVTAITTGDAHTCALLRSGGVKCWGSNVYGSLGTGTSGSANTPMDVAGITSGVSALVSGDYHTCALTDSGDVKCWGGNRYGQIGNGAIPDRNTPVAVLANYAVPVYPYIAPTSNGFRPTGPLVPEITTYIPTPLDISTDLGVIGTNLGLAAIASILFAIGAELFTRILAEHEAGLPKPLRPAVEQIHRVQMRLGAWMRKIFRRPTLFDAVKLGGIMLFYGLVFSLLERGWNPFTLTGFYLLFSMTIAYGVVGLSDDIAQWRAARRMGIPATLSVHPTNILLAVGSTTISRGFSMVPGLMFGTPEALVLDESTLDPSKKTMLLRIGSGTLIGIGLVAWLLTIGTTLLQRAALPDWLGILLGGLESLLLLVFTVTLENVFVRILGLPGSMGQALRKWNRWIWGGILLLVIFMFYHFLLNPKGGLASVLEESNVAVFLIIALVFTVIAAGLWFFLHWRERRKAGTKQDHAQMASELVPAPPEKPSKSKRQSAGTIAPAAVIPPMVSTPASSATEEKQPKEKTEPAIEVLPPARAFNTSVERADGEIVQCQQCGKSLRVKTMEKGTIVFSTPEARRGIAWLCQECGFITCEACATNPANPTKSVCPSCGEVGGPFYFPPVETQSIGSTKKPGVISATSAGAPADRTDGRKRKARSGSQLLAILLRFSIVAVGLSFLAFVTIYTTETNTHATQTVAARLTGVSKLKATNRAAEQTRSANATVVSANKTATVISKRSTSTAKAQQTAQVAVNTVESQSQWRIKLSENFNSNRYGWTVGSKSGTLAKRMLSIVYGKYRYEVTAFGSFIWRTRPSGLSNLTDFYLEVEGCQVEGPKTGQFGVAFRETGDAFYLFRIDEQGYYYFGIVDKEEYKDLISWRAHSAIHPGENSHITISAQGSHFFFLINDEFVAEFDNDQLKSGKTSLVVGLDNAGDKAVFEFDNFEVRVP